MGWKWTRKDPNPTYFYHKALWESEFELHFYKICNGVIFPIHQTMFNERSPRISNKASIDILLVARWFGEENFTYIRAFGILSAPHVFPYYFLDNILAR